LLERERELAALRTAIGEAVEGQARVVLVEGSAGARTTGSGTIPRSPCYTRSIG
jgi:hypothetical protein